VPRAQPWPSSSLPQEAATCAGFEGAANQRPLPVAEPARFGCCTREQAGSRRSHPISRAPTAPGREPTTAPGYLALPAQEQRQGRTLHPHPARRMGLRGHLPRQRPAHRRPVRLARGAQLQATARRPEPPAPGHPPRAADREHVRGYSRPWRPTRARHLARASQVSAGQQPSWQCSSPPPTVTGSGTASFSMISSAAAGPDDDEPRRADRGLIRLPDLGAPRDARSPRRGPRPVAPRQ
jgi:hypothetical protein